MSEKDELNSLKENLLDSQKLENLKNNDIISGMSFAFIFGKVLAVNDENFKSEILNFLVEREPNNLGSSFDNLKNKIGDDIDFILCLLSTKIDLIDRNKNLFQEKNEKGSILKKTKDLLRLEIGNLIESKSSELSDNIGDNTMDKIEEIGIFNGIINASARGEAEPSLSVFETFTECYAKKFNKLPPMTQAGNAQSLLLISGRYDIAEKYIRPIDLIDYSSNSAQQLPDKDNRKSTLFEERANTTENTSIERGNLTYLFELIKYYLRNNYSLEKNENVDLERFNKHFFESFKKLNEFTLQNRNNPEVIKEINYMLNCTISISNKNYTTLADFVKNELKFNDNLTKEQREIFNNFAGIMGIEQNQELNIQNLKLLDINEASELVKAYNNSNFAKEFNESQVFLLTTYGSNAVNYDKLKKEVEENRNISNEKVFNYLVNNGFQDLSGYTVTPKIFKSAVDNSINLDNIKVETKGQTIPGDLVKLIVSHGHHDFSEANIKLSKEDKEDIAEFSGLTEISKRDFKIGFFTGNSKIEKINKNLNEMMTIINSFKPSDAFFDKSIIEDIRSTQESINKYQKTNWFVKLFNKNSLTKSVKKCSNIINNAFKTDYMKLSNNFSNSTFLDAKQKSAQIEKNKINIRESRENNKDISPQINL